MSIGLLPAGPSLIHRSCETVLRTPTFKRTPTYWLTSAKEKAPRIAARGRGRILVGPEETFARSELVVTVGCVDAVDNERSGGEEY